MCIHLLPDLQCSLAEGFSLLVLAPLAVKHSQVVECCGYSRMILPQSFLSDGQSVIQEVSRLFVFVLVPLRQTQ